MSDDISALRRKLQQIEARHRNGELAGDAYAAEKARLERALVDQVLGEPAAGGKSARPSGRLFAALAVFVVAVAGAGYWWTGSPGLAGGAAQEVSSASPADAAAHADNERKFAQAVDELAEKMKQRPEQAEGWALLARSYVRLGRLEPALDAFKKAVALRGDDAALLVDYADVLAVANGRKLDGEPSQLIARALALDPDNLKALSLAGAAAFDRKDYAGAVQHWERVVQLSPPGSPYLPELQSGIDEARRQGGIAPGATAAADAKPTPATTPSAAAGAIRGTVSLAPALAAKAAPTDTVFVYARAADGPRMPLAILRLQVKDLPASFTLDDSSAMSPAAKLSASPRVIVSARVSKSGQAATSPGDLIGETPAMGNHADGVALEIDKIVQN